MSTLDAIDCAVVGGGVSGLYANFRLAAARPGWRTVVFESSARLGGRLETVDVPGTSSRAELGAMRFVPAHRLLDSLLTHLDVASEPFPNRHLRRLHVRGRTFAGAELAGAILPYALAGHERGVDPYALLAGAIEALVPGAFSLGPAQWREVAAQRRHRGVLLRDLGCAAALRDVVSGEAYRMLLDVVGIESVLSEYNAVCALRLLASLLPAFAAGQARRPAQGWSTLTDRLAAGATIERQQRLTAVRRVGEAEPLILEFVRGEHTVHVRARSLILALPARALTHVAWHGLDPATLRAGLAQVVAEPAFRLLSRHERPFWAELGAPDGHAVTDQPIRQVFYGMGVGGAPHDDARVLMAPFCDGAAARYWSSLARQHEARADGEPSALDRHVRAGLCELHGVDAWPDPAWTAWRDWSAEPYGGGWHAWSAGVDVAAAVASMRRPFAGAPVYVCGEAFASLQGFVEGALQSAERLVQQVFGLSAPAWLEPGEYDLGP